MIVALSSLAGAALLTAAAGQEPPLAPFPGVWNTSAAGCADPESQDGLVIEGGKITGYEWGGDVVSVHWNRDNRATADLNLWDTSDVDADLQPIRRQETWGFSLSPDRQTLTIRFVDATQTFVRCRRSRL